MKIVGFDDDETKNRSMQQRVQRLAKRVVCQSGPVASVQVGIQKQAEQQKRRRPNTPSAGTTISVLTTTPHSSATKKQRQHSWQSSQQQQQLPTDPSYMNPTFTD